MNINTLLISEEYVRTNSNVSDNLDSCLIVPSIVDAQLQGLMPIIGEPLFDKLCEMVENDALEGKYKGLVDNYIAIYLLNAVLAEMVIDNYTRQHNAGSVQYQDTNYMQTGLSELKFVHQHYIDKAAFYANRLTEYLHAHESDFPEYHKHVCGQMHHSDNANIYHCGIALGSKITRNRKDK